MWRQKIFSSCSHLDVLEVLNAALGPWSDFTDGLSAEHYVSVSAILLVLNILSPVYTAKISRTTLDQYSLAR